MDSFEEDALEYAQGYIIRKLHLTNSENINKVIFGLSVLIYEYVISK